MVFKAEDSDIPKNGKNQTSGYVGKRCRLIKIEITGLLF